MNSLTLEAVFAATIVLAASSMFIEDCAPPNAQPVVTSNSAHMAVVVVSARRMNAEEKLKSVQIESAHASERT